MMAWALIIDQVIGLHMQGPQYIIAAEEPFVTCNYSIVVVVASYKCVRFNFYSELAVMPPFFFTVRDIWIHAAAG